MNGHVAALTIPMLMHVYVHHLGRSSRRDATVPSGQSSSIGHNLPSVSSSGASTLGIDLRDTHILMMNLAQTLAPYMWLTATQQIMSRITHPSKDVVNVLTTALARCIVEYPAQSLWLIGPACLHHDQVRQQRGKEILSAACSMGADLKFVDVRWLYCSCETPLLFTMSR